jgi:DNA-binding SARP family transcriptional activator/tetratricopeptide (TPR) repeat protein
VSTPRFGVLGPLELRVDGAPVALPVGLQHRLLGALLVRWGGGVRPEALVDLFWEADPPPTADRTLRSHVSRLRSFLAELDPELGIDQSRAGYALRPGSAELDRIDFEAALAAARRAQAGGDHPRAVAAAERALGLWRGQAYEGLADLPLVHGEAARLDELRADAVEVRAASLLELGAEDGLVGELVSAVDDLPLREGFRHLLMRALARAGRHAEALRCYEDYRVRLAEESGLDPSDRLQALQRRVLDEDATLLAGPSGEHGRLIRWDLPAELVPPAAGLVGRGPERRVLRDAVTRVAAGGRGVVVVSGEAGVGKSHLVADAAQRAHEDGAVVLYGGCDEAVRAPMAPFVRALRFFRTQAGEQADELLGPWWPELARLVPEAQAEVTGAERDPQTAMLRLFDAVVGWLGSLAAQDPVVLVVEDVHWAGETTLLLLKRLCSAPELRRLLLVLTVREPEPDRPSLVDDVIHASRRTGVLLAHLELEGLSPAEVHELATGLRDDLGDHSEAIATVIAERTAGNPLFVQEMLAGIPSGGGDALERLGAPPSARHLVTRRLRQLDADAALVLADAALIGGEVALDLLSDVALVDTDGVLRALDAAVDAGLLDYLPTDDLHLRFAHAVVREALVDRLGRAERIAGHQRIVAALLRLPEPRRRVFVEDLARHASEAALVNGPRGAIPHVVRAGEQAIDRRAYGHAAGWYARALELADLVEPGAEGVADRFELLCALGDAQRRAGDPAFRASILAAAELARARGDDDGVARAGLLGSRGFFRQTAVPDHPWIDLLDEAVASSGETSREARSLLLASLASELVWSDPDERRFALSDEAVALARASGSPVLLEQVLVLRLVAVWAPDTVQDRLDAVEEVLALTAQTGDRALRCHALRFGAAAALEQGDRRLAETRLEDCRVLTEEAAQPDLAWHLDLAQAGWWLLDGDLDAAAAEARRALRAGRLAGEPEALSFFGAVDLEIRRLRGTLEEVIDLVVAAGSDLPPDPALGFLRHLCAGGRQDEAWPAYLAAVERLDDLGRGVHTLAALANLAYLAGWFGDAETAERLAPRLEPYADLYPQAIVILPIGHHHLGVLAATVGWADKADEHFAAAVAAHQACRAPVCEAESHLEWGRFLARESPDRRAEAKHHLDEARRLARAHGALGLARAAGR